MSRYDELYKAIAATAENSKEPEMVPAVPNFPYKTMYPGQRHILDAVAADGHTSFCISSHTGFGKTPVFQTLARNQATIVIEPRKFLQVQAAKYFGDTILYGRSAYYCPHAGTRGCPDAFKTAAVAPCLAKVDCDSTTYHNTCPDATATCLNKPCKIFDVYGEYHKYPCKGCLYHEAIKRAISTLGAKGTVVCNFGNFWPLLKSADMVVVDEADMFFREVSAPIKLRYSTPKKNQGDGIKNLLVREIEGLEKDLEDAGFSRKYSAKNALYAAEFMNVFSDLCFMYQRKDAYYIEIDPRKTGVLQKKIFDKKKVVIVGATSGVFDMPSYSASIHQRCGIFFATVGNLTSKSLKQNPYLMGAAARAIIEIGMFMDMTYDSDRIVIHCGNIGTHATSLYKILGEEDCIIHEKGKLAETIDRYLASDKKYLLVASASHGGDFGWCKLQFILKFPYPTLDERMRTLERAMGPEFREYYEGEARTQIIQTAGRNVRGFNDFGITINLDSKIYEDYCKNKNLYPDWYRERVNPRCY